MRSFHIDVSISIICFTVLLLKQVFASMYTRNVTDMVTGSVGKLINKAICRCFAENCGQHLDVRSNYLQSVHEHRGNSWPRTYSGRYVDEL